MDMVTPTIDSEQLTKLIRDPIIVRIVSVLDIASLSILELLEYDLSRNDINHALSNGVIAIDKSTSSAYDYDCSYFSFFKRAVLARNLITILVLKIYSNFHNV